MATEEGGQGSDAPLLISFIGTTWAGVNSAGRPQAHQSWWGRGGGVRDRGGKLVGDSMLCRLPGGARLEAQILTSCKFHLGNGSYPLGSSGHTTWAQQPGQSPVPAIHEWLHRMQPTQPTERPGAKQG